MYLWPGISECVDCFVVRESRHRLSVYPDDGVANVEVVVVLVAADLEKVSTTKEQFTAKAAFPRLTFDTSTGRLLSTPPLMLIPRPESGCRFSFTVRTFFEEEKCTLYCHCKNIAWTFARDRSTETTAEVLENEACTGEFPEDCSVISSITLNDNVSSGNHIGFLFMG